LRGFDQFMNVVLDQTVDMKSKTDIGMVVSGSSIFAFMPESPACSISLAEVIMISEQDGVNHGATDAAAYVDCSIAV
jgi:small nuclear ribonucleoprotein (snRNP)-like protein